jgi:hypothetical protein
VLQGFTSAQFYDVVADNSVPYNVVGGLQDNGTWIGPSRSRFREGVGFDDWQTIWSGDGFGAQTDPLEPWIVFATSQNGSLGFVDMRTGNQGRMNRARPRQGTARFNWDAPFILSPHNRLTLWHAGNFVFRSMPAGTFTITARSGGRTLSTVVTLPAEPAMIGDVLVGSLAVAPLRPALVKGAHVIQAGAFRDDRNASQLLDRLRRSGEKPFAVNIGALTFVYVGPFETRRDAVEASHRMKRSGFDGYLTRR